MEVIVGGRLSGKTHALIGDALKHDGVVVVAHDGKRREAIDQLAKRLMERDALGAPQALVHAERLVITYAEATRNSSVLFSIDRPIYIDDADVFFQYVLPVRKSIHAISVLGNARTPQGLRLFGGDYPLPEVETSMGHRYGDRDPEEK